MGCRGWYPQWRFPQSPWPHPVRQFPTVSPLWTGWSRILWGQCRHIGGCGSCTAISRPGPGRMLSGLFFWWSSGMAWSFVQETVLCFEQCTRHWHPSRRIQRTRSSPSLFGCRFYTSCGNIPSKHCLWAWCSQHIELVWENSMLLWGRSHLHKLNSC